MTNLKGIISICALLVIFFECSLAGRITQSQPLEAGNSYVKQTRIKSVVVESSDAGALREAAIAKGMDATAVDELLREHKPVVRISTDAQGLKKKTTYSFTSKGGIMSQTEEEVSSTSPSHAITASDSQFSDFFSNNNHRPSLSDSSFSNIFGSSFNRDSQFSDIFKNFPSTSGGHLLPSTGHNVQQFSEKTSKIFLQSTDRNRIREGAIQRGLDPKAIDELFASGKPVVRTQTDKAGQRETVTYSLTANGGVEIVTKTESHTGGSVTPAITVHRNVPTIPTRPARPSIPARPTSTYNSNGVDEDVLRDIERNIVNTAPKTSHRDVENDWEWVTTTPRYGRLRGI